MRVQGSIRGWFAVVLVVAVLAACGESSGADVADTAPAGNAAQFCAMWPDVRSTLLGVIRGDTSFDLLGDETVGLDKLMASHDLAMEEADAIVPGAIRSSWDVGYGAYRSVSDLLFTTFYTDAVIRPAHLTMAFGDTGYGAAVASAEAAVAAIDDWSVETCGNFCSRWPEFGSILRYEENFDWGRWHDNLDQYELALTVGDRLVPDAVKAQWDIAVDIQRRRMTMFRDNGNSLDVDEATALARWGVVTWDVARPASDAALEAIGEWADANCDASILTSGAPGTVSVRYPQQSEIWNRAIVSVLLPAGTAFGEVRSLDSYVAVMCSEMGGAPTDPLRPISGQGEYFTADLCHLIRHEERAVVPGGAYELFVGAFLGGPGAYGLYFAAPERCVQIPIGVNGDTVVDVPPLEPCDLEPIGSPEEIARRGVQAVEATGRLWFEVDSGVKRDDFDFCRLDAVLVDAGTTLNQVGRGEVWPTGLVNFHLAASRELEGANLQLAQQPGLVPILAMPPSGTGEMMVYPDFDSGSWDSVVDPVVIAAGRYDLRFTQWCAREDGGEQSWCAMVTVDVDGDTVVAMPALGACP